MNKTACIFGSTGLVGSNLLTVLSKDERYSKIIVFNRKKIEIPDSKVEQIVDVYENLTSIAAKLYADEYYCCLGTTIKKAKTKPAFEYVDLHLPLEIGRLAVLNKVPKLLVVSSIGASPKTKNFYLNVKGRMESSLKNLGIEQLSIFRPSMLLGNRSEMRAAESIGKVLMKLIGFLLIGRLKKYKAIEAEVVAKAMVLVANSNYGSLILESNEIQEIGLS